MIGTRVLARCARLLVHNMKRGTPNHPKVAALAAELQIPHYAAVGILEMLWQFAAIYAKSGAIGKHDDDAIAKCIKWDRSPSELIRALCARHWLDEHPKYRLLIHDWAEHCPDSVHVYLHRNGLRFADGTAPNAARLSRRERLRIKKEHPRPKTEPGLDAVVATKPVQEIGMDDNETFARQWLAKYYPDPTKLCFTTYHPHAIHMKFIALINEFPRDMVAQAVLDAIAKGSVGEPVAYAGKVLYSIRAKNDRVQINTEKQRFTKTGRTHS